MKFRKILQNVEIWPKIPRLAETVGLTCHTSAYGSSVILQCVSKKLHRYE